MSVDAEPFADRLPSYLTRFVGREQEVAELLPGESVFVSVDCARRRRACVNALLLGSRLATPTKMVAASSTRAPTKPSARASPCLFTTG